jgi:catechol 2,3-dioxygenase-like lactoylglutathione lyase family enzyme
MPAPVFDQINIVAADLDATVAFYRRMGVEMREPIRDAKGEPFHVSGGADGGLLFEADSPRFARIWNRGWQDAGEIAGRVVIGLRVEDRAAVDRLVAEVEGAGYRVLQSAHDAFWGARYAIVEDPDGIAVGLMSPADDAHRSPPPGFEEPA